MRKILLSFILCLRLVGIISAQSNEQLLYKIALERIEEARVSEATELDLSGLGLIELPSEIGNLNSLQKLYLNENSLTSLPPEISRLANLQILGLRGNELTSLLPEIGKLGNLQALGLGGNQLASLPSEIGKLGNLQWLGLGGNQLSNLPAEIAHLEALCYLDLSNNLFQHLPSELGQLHHLTIATECPYIVIGIDYDDNPLISPPPEVLVEGTAAILDYLRNAAWWHMQRVIIGAAGSIGLVAALVLGLRWKNRRGLKEKEKRG
jgi:internalin A